MRVSLGSSTPSPAPLGAPVTWIASVSNPNPGTLWYRFRAGKAASQNTDLAATPISRGFLPARSSGQSLRPRRPPQLRTVVDYGPKSSFTWSTIDGEGIYQIDVTVQNQDTGETASASAQFELTPLAAADVAAITPTSHPLVFVYSAPACPQGSSMTVQFQSAEGTLQSTPAKACDSQTSMNFYIAGIRAHSQFTAWHVIDNGTTQTAAGPMPFATGEISIKAPVVVPLTSAIPSTDGILLQSILQAPSIATDLAGNVVWYGPTGISFFTRPQTGGTFMGIHEDGTQGPSQQTVLEFDLVGNVIAETNAARINRQLAALGMHPINAFHHEARKLPNGGYLVLADSERILTDVQGPGDADVIGDTILVLNSDLQLTWAWDAFDHLDPHRMAILGEQCAYPAGLVCAPFYLAKTANDWLHGNALQLTPDGNILYSIRHQDWIVKIDYENGAGSGDILWRLGPGGDFGINASDAWPWFSHQHDPNLELDGATLAVFDDGNTRAAADPTIHSRGQVLLLDEVNRNATLLLNGDLGTYSYALGSAQRLLDGDYHFDAGIAPDPAGHGGTVAQSLELNMSGQLVYGIQFGALEYRSFRMPDLYTAP
ncbi:MAG TPA: aryl-sulfate sulfotransferase [Bryobacteraceae bacterium]|nr:aryl-sulfate sulfotransferase [Bryobacteraceae bacterium]